MDHERGYNGYRNYQTWAVMLWLGNEQTAYNVARVLVWRATKRAAPAILAAWVEDQCGKGWGLRSDLLTHARRTGTAYYTLLRQVDWPRLVDALRGD